MSRSSNWRISLLFVRKILLLYDIVEVCFTLMLLIYFNYYDDANAS